MATFTLDIPPYFNESLGSLGMAGFNFPTSVLVSGNHASSFDIDKIYEVVGQNFWFKFDSVLYDGSTFTILSYPQFVGTAPAPGTYEIKEYFYEALPIYGRSICMLGDSITAKINGSYLRALLRENGLTYDFAGKYIDTFGFRHNAVGSNTTTNQLNNSMSLVPTCDSYNVLLGSADAAGSPADTITNLVKICKYLHQRNPEAEINLCTLVLRDPTDRNIAVSSLLRKVEGLPNVHLLDLEAYLPAWGVWQGYLIDGVHPNLAGYTDYIAPILAAHIR
jgi:hypothetical protein